MLTNVYHCTHIVDHVVIDVEKLIVIRGEYKV